MAADKILEWQMPIAARQLKKLTGRDADAGSESEFREDENPTEAAGVKLSRMTRYIELADLWYRSDGSEGDRQDAYQLPGFVLEAVTGLPDNVVLLIGSWVRDELGVPEANSREIGRLWIEDVKGTAWRLLMEHGSWPGHHAEKRRSLDTRHD
jgi:hypothetical protein